MSHATPEIPIRFVLNGALTQARVPATQTLLEYLRQQAGLCGTKEGCAEGDCGACTVVKGELNDQGQIEWRAVNACIHFMPTVHACEVVTVEGLSDADGSLHPAQQAMVDCHGSQCGFCTPGFVMSLFAQHLKRSAEASIPAAAWGPQDIASTLSGNLCRCTGYRPILDAAERMMALPVNRRWAPELTSDPQRAATLQACAQAELAVESPANGAPAFAAPDNLAQFSAHYEANPKSLILAGGTDVGLWVTKQLRELGPLLHIGRVRELQVMRPDGEGLWIGAAVRLEEAYARLCQDHPELRELHDRFASLPIRNGGTLCGNVANGSPIGDSMPALIALGAQVCLRQGQQTRRLAMEDFYLDYRKQDLRQGEFVEAVWVPRRVANALCEPQTPAPVSTFTRVYKVSKRRDQDISALCAGLSVAWGPDTRVLGVRLAWGGMAATPKRAKHAEAALREAGWCEAGIQAAMRALEQDFSPMTDMRASNRYRMAVAKNLLERWWLEAQGGITSATPLGPGASLWQLQAVEAI